MAATSSAPNIVGPIRIVHIVPGRFIVAEPSKAQPARGSGRLAAAEAARTTAI
jgi:hypothetical protein